MLSVPEAAPFIPAIMLWVIGVGFTASTVIYMVLRARSPRKKFYEFRIVSLLAVLMVGMFAIVIDAYVYEHSQGDATLLEAEIQRVYGLEVGYEAATALLDGLPAEVGGVTYRLSDDRLEQVEGWSAVEVP